MLQHKVEGSQFVNDDLIRNKVLHCEELFTVDVENNEEMSKF